MKKIRRSPVVTGLLFLLAVVLLFAGGVGGTQAALQVYSENYYSALNMKNIGVTLYENGKDTSNRIYGKTAASGWNDRQDGELILDRLGDDPYFKIGKKYPFVITAANSGDIDAYLRISVYKYWVKVGGDEEFGLKGWFHGISNYTSKIVDDSFAPAKIHLGYGGSEGYNSSSWILDKASHTDERDIYYYVGILPSGSTTKPLFDTLWIDSSVAKAPTVSTSTTDDGKTITSYTYDYDGYGFVVQVETDAIQTHNARAAIRSGWGMQDEDILSQMNVPAESK